MENLKSDQVSFRAIDFSPPKILIADHEFIIDKSITATISLYFCFGDYDLMGVVDFPDSRGVAAWSMAVSSGGDVRAFKTTTLLSIEEGLQALGRASQATRAARSPDAPD